MTAPLDEAAREATVADFAAERSTDSISLLDLVTPLLESWKLLIFGPLLIGSIAVGVTFWMKPVYSSRTVFLPPQQPQSAAASALASLGNLAGLAGAGGGRTPADQYVALMQSSTVADRMIARFSLMQTYEAKLRSDAIRVLGANTRISIGKKDGLISVDVDDHDPKRAADMANAYVEELRAMTSALAITEAQQRRAFFEGQLRTTRDQLTKAQRALQGSGFDPGAMQSEPRAVAEAYAQLQAQVTSAEIRLQMLRRGLADSAPEVQQQAAAVTALKSQLARVEQPSSTARDVDYVARFREFKYQEALFEMFSRQYEIARVDEAREAALIQVVDVATPADRRTSPKRAFTGVAFAVASGFVLAVFVLLREAWRRAVAASRDSPSSRRFRMALRRS